MKMFKVPSDFRGDPWSGLRGDFHGEKPLLGAGRIGVTNGDLGREGGAENYTKI